MTAAPPVVVDPAKPLLGTGSPVMAARHGWTQPHPQTASSRKMRPLTKHPVADMALQMFQRAVLPPPPADLFGRPDYVRPDLVHRLGGPHYASVAGRAEELQRLMTSPQGGLLSLLERSNSAYRPYTDVLRQYTAGGQIPVLNQLAPIL